jgi:hypothetical protein
VSWQNFDWMSYIIWIIYIHSISEAGCYYLWVEGAFYNYSHRSGTLSFYLKKETANSVTPQIFLIHTIDNVQRKFSSNIACSLMIVVHVGLECT